MELGGHGLGAFVEPHHDEVKTTRILVVEDDAFMATALVTMLRSIADASDNYKHGAKLPLQVEHSATGEGAWDLLSSKQFDIAFVDIKPAAGVHKMPHR